MKLADIDVLYKREAKAALAIGWEVMTTPGAGLTANGAMFSPRWFDAHAMALVFQAQTNGFVGPTGERANFDIRIDLCVTSANVVIGAKRFTRLVEDNPHNAFRLAILDAFEAYYDAVLA
jgi:hypothetical protein